MVMIKLKADFSIANMGARRMRDIAVSSSC